MGIASRNKTLAFGSFGLMTEDFGWVTSRQLEAARRVLTRYVRRGGKIWTRIFPDRPVTKKAMKFQWAEARALRIIMWPQ